jgi:tetratricopeptide (TPR) repeat protein
LSLLVSQKAIEPAYTPGVTTTANQKRRLVVVAASGTAILLIICFWRPLTAVFYANLGAVEMAQVHLKGWPAERVEGESLLAVIGPAESILQKALQYNPKQASALYRLGMIASERRDYERANQFLSRAYEVYPAHYGVRKMLGYSYLWLGNVDKAAVLLKPDSETLEDLDFYTYWWKTQNRADLSSLAQQLVTRLRITRK